MANTPDDRAILGFHITFEPRVHIEFSTKRQAEAYLDKIKKRSVYIINALDGQQDGVHGNIMSIRLPSRIVCASMRNSRTYLTFSDKQLAKDWVKGLGIWEFLDDGKGNLSEFDVALMTGLSNKRLNKSLQIEEDRPQQRTILPRTHQRQAGNKVPGVAMRSTERG
ncbi:hypothetical protein C8A01DRAFT_31812 [Parachaetomium inaequale]|uniref:Uncharacterized protein n=1 Tax=Parachaetomium inaequale TaxID=2588326 RepID=A0AAN6PRY9_9PEZI|nr:hypothetical protein C8A01DRAFT_31812 [Parachaetomium inaequale]